MDDLLQLVSRPRARTRYLTGRQKLEMDDYESRGTVNDVDYMDEMNNPSNMKCILSKLPFKLKEKWRSYAYDIKERRKKQARFPDLVDFVYHQAKVVNNPLFGDILDATIGSQGNSKKKANVRKGETKRSSFAVSVCAIDKDSTEGQPETKPPAVNLANAFQSPCLYSGHLSKDCKKRASCPDCSLKHPAILHMVKEDPTLEKNRDGSSKDTAECFLANRISVSSIEDMLIGHYNADFPERRCEDKQEPSQYDKQFMHTVTTSAHLIDGHYCIKLPLKDDGVKMPCNHGIAEQRLNSLRRRKFNRN
ncbi:hypothetical protein MHYP_G00297790 [Metynnis hypsauchen]